MVAEPVPVHHRLAALPAPVQPSHRWARSGEPEPDPMLRVPQVGLAGDVVPVEHERVLWPLISIATRSGTPP